MVEIWLVVEDATGLAVNAVEWDPDAADWSPQAGFTPVRASEQGRAWIGWTLTNGVWSAPQPD